MDAAKYGAVDAAGAGSLAPPGNSQDLGDSTSGVRENKPGRSSGGGTESTVLIPTGSVDNAHAKEKPPISTRMAIFLVVNYMIGSGILNTPQTFRDSGIAATTVLYLLACKSVYFARLTLAVRLCTV